MRKLAGALLLLSIATCAEAGTSTPWGMGGNLGDFDAVIRQADQSGELFRIEGHCQSACTMFLRIRSVCVDRRAQLLFHAANNGPAFTNRMLASYNSALQAYVTANHYMDGRQLHAIPGAEIIQKFGYPECPKK